MGRLGVIASSTQRFSCNPMDCMYFILWPGKNAYIPLSFVNILTRRRKT